MQAAFVADRMKIALPLLWCKKAVVAAFTQRIVLQPNAVLALRNIEIRRVLFVPGG